MEEIQDVLPLLLLSATVIAVAICIYKAVQRLVSAPKELVKQAGASGEELIRTFASEFRKIFGSEPKITVDRQVVVTGSAAIRELALYKETILLTENWASTSWKSTKSILVQQPFTIKAGFDLNRLKFDFDLPNKRVTATISDSTIVNVEHAGDFQVLREEHGLWNRISRPERDTLLNSLPIKAREEAGKLELRDKAAKQLRIVLERLLPPDLELAIEFSDHSLQFENKLTPLTCEN